MAKIGLKNIYVAAITAEDEESVTYDTPRKISKAMTASVVPSYENATLYGDDAAQEIVEELTGIAVTLGVNSLNLEDYAYLMGKTVDANGGVSDNAKDQAPYVAIGYETPLSNGGVRMTWIYKAKFSTPTEEDTTKQGTPSFQTPTISANSIPRQHDGEWRYRVDSNETNEAIIENWFSAVQENL